MKKRNWLSMGMPLSPNHTAQIGTLVERLKGMFTEMSSEFDKIEPIPDEILIDIDIGGVGKIWMIGKLIRDKETG